MNINRYYLFYGYDISDKYNEINSLEESREDYWDGLPDFSLNYSNNEIGYLLIKDCVQKEELYFGKILFTFEDCEYIENDESFSVANIQKFNAKIEQRYIDFFKEKPNKEFKLFLICENI